MNEPATFRNVIWSIDNASGILEPQTYNAVSFKSRSQYNCLEIPLSAITNSEKTATFVVTPQKIIERRKIKTGADDGDFIEVVDGLKQGEIVVSHGKAGLTDGMLADVTLENFGGDNH